MLTLASPILLADSEHWHGPGWWVIFPICWLLFFCAIFWFCVVGRARGFRPTGRQQGEARLAERFAAGEIDEQEYRQRLGVLREKR